MNYWLIILNYDFDVKNLIEINKISNSAKKEFSNILILGIK